MTEKQYLQAKNLMDEIGRIDYKITKIDGNIKALNGLKGHDCIIYIQALGKYDFHFGSDAEFDLFPLSEQIVEVIIKQLNDRKEEYKNKIKELKKIMLKI